MPGCCGWLAANRWRRNSLDTEAELLIGRVLSHLDEEEVIELTKSLVAIPSDEPDGEIECARALASFLSEASLEVQLHEVEGAGLNVIARLPGDSENAGVLYNGHLDTVPPSEKMPFNPFTPTEKDGCLWGRGTVDMKGGAAAMACALKVLRAADLGLKYSLVFTGVAGEERGNLGTAKLVRQGIQAKWAIVGEATGLNLVIAHKGVDRYEVIVKGRSAHESMPERGDNAILRAAAIIHGLHTNLWPRVAQVTHPVLGAGTYNIGMIRGGIRRNVIPEQCMFKIGKRYLPGDCPDAIRAELEGAIQEANPEAQFELRHEPEFDQFDHPPLFIPNDHALPRSLGAMIEHLTGHNPTFESWGAFTDGALLQAAGIPTVIFGPGDVTLAHCDDERIPIHEIKHAARVYAAFGALACSVSDPNELLAMLHLMPYTHERPRPTHA